MWIWKGDLEQHEPIQGIAPQDYSDEEFNEISAEYDARGFEKGSLKRSKLWDHKPDKAVRADKED